MGSDYTLSREDWSLHRKGILDQERHRAKVAEAIRKNLVDIVSQESIIMADGQKVVKVPIRSLEEYHLRFDPAKEQNAGQGQGGSQPGSVLGRDPSPTAGGPGEDPGNDYYEAEITVDELAEILFSELELPNLAELNCRQIPAEGINFRSVGKVGITSNLDKKRTLLEAIKRAARHGESGPGAIAKEDVRFRIWEEEERAENAALVMAMLDTSGSMGDFEKYVARSFFTWLVRFLRSRYQSVELVFLAHSTEAKEVSEAEFFTKGESGGTKCSSVYRLALEIIAQRYGGGSQVNIYPFHFTDGDNLTSDNQHAQEAVRELMGVARLFGYGEIRGDSSPRHTLLSFLRAMNDPRLKAVEIWEKADIYRALRAFLGKEGFHQ